MTSIIDYKERVLTVILSDKVCQALVKLFLRADILVQKLLNNMKLEILLQ